MEVTATAIGKSVANRLCGPFLTLPDIDRILDLVCLYRGTLDWKSTKVF